MPQGGWGAGGSIPAASTINSRPTTLGCLFSCGILPTCGGSWGLLRTSGIGLPSLSGLGSRSEGRFPLLLGQRPEARSARSRKVPSQIQWRMTGRIERLDAIIAQRTQ